MKGIAISGKWIKMITWCLRILTGATFLFSGFVKAIDPWGTIYKLDDYIAAMHFSMPFAIVLLAAFFLFSAEFFCGVSLCLGCFRRFTPWLAAAFMIVMLPLTLWIAIANPVADCGCFGDAWVISNWATFWKNVLLSLAIVWLIKFSYKSKWLITPSLQWLAFLASGIFIICVGLLGYEYQPLLDFRPYPIGSNLTTDTNALQDNMPQMQFIYEKNGEKKTFSESNLPDESEGWTFVERIEPKHSSAESDGLVIWDEQGDDVTADVIASATDQIIIFMPELNHVSSANIWLINSLESWCDNQGIDMLAVVGATPEDVEAWRDVSMADYPIYTAEDTSIKEVVRGNPAVIYIKDGIIKWKSSLRALDTDDFLAKETPADPMSFAHDNNLILRNLSSLYILVIAILLIASFMPRLKGVYSRQRKYSRINAAKKEEKISGDDTVRREE